MNLEERIISFLKSKNGCLYRYLDISESFLSQIKQGSYDSLMSFEREREVILNIVSLYDKKIEESSTQILGKEVDSKFSQDVRNFLAEKEKIIEKILEVDCQIIDLIEKEKVKSQIEVKQSKESRSQMSKFKSSWVPESGKELDDQL